jgi:hypothetical protein
MSQVLELPGMPPIGQSESWYTKRIHFADAEKDVHRHESLKVAQYLTLALDGGLSWPQKQRYIEHALHRHCTPPPSAAPSVLTFYEALRELVKRYAGEEAVRVASRADDQFAQRVAGGEPREEVAPAAKSFLQHIVGDTHRTPDWLHFEDWHELIVLLNAWA